jgi:hypothetical protein
MKHDAPSITRWCEFLEGLARAHREHGCEARAQCLEDVAREAGEIAASLHRLCPDLRRAVDRIEALKVKLMEAK